MPLTYHPRIGEVLLCDYDTGFIPPEMTKRRPVVTVSPRLRRRDNLVTVIPLSTTAPDGIESYHYEIEFSRLLPKPFDAKIMWAKCDMVATVARTRLDRFKDPAKARGSQHKFVTGQLSDEQLILIRRGMLHALGLSVLTVHLI